MDSSDNKEIVVFTDGACKGNGKPHAKAASAVVWPNGEFRDQVFYLPPTDKRSNNRAEYYAIIKAMELMNEIDPERSKTLHVYTDCNLAIQTCTKWMFSWYRKGWKKSTEGEIKNLDLVKALYQLCKERNIRFTHVKAHTGGKDFQSVWNDRADKCAYEAVTRDDISLVVREIPKIQKMK